MARASSAADVVRKLPPVEREARLTKLREKLPGIDLTRHQEPSYELVDAFSAMLEARSVRWVPFHRCTSREQELSARSYNKELQVMQSQDGKLSLKEGQASRHANVSDGLRVQQAMSRRAAAAEIAGLATFDALQKWHTYLLNTLTQQPPQGFTPVALEQLTAADKELWMSVSHKGGGKRGSAAEQPKLNDPLLAIALAELAGSCSGLRIRYRGETQSTSCTDASIGTASSGMAAPCCSSSRATLPASCGLSILFLARALGNWAEPCHGPWTWRWTCHALWVNP